MLGARLGSGHIHLSFFLSNQMLVKEIAACYPCRQAATRGGSSGGMWAPWQCREDSARCSDVPRMSKTAPRWMRPLKFILCVGRGQCGQERRGREVRSGGHSSPFLRVM